MKFKIKRTIATLGLAGILALSGCEDEKPEYLEGEIIGEGGSAVNLVKSSGAMFGNESVKLGEPSYVITVKTDKGAYIINVTGNHYRPVIVLAEAAKTRKHIKFRTNHFDGVYNFSYFSADRIGNVPSYEIEFH